MSTSSTLTDRFGLLVIILAVLSCDSLTGPDTVTPEKFTQSDYYILPGTSAIIDLESIVDQSFLNGTLNVFEKPKRGTLSYATTSMLKYKPEPEFQEGEDHFVLSVVSDGKILAKGTMTIKMKKSNGEFPCALVPVEDKIKLKAGSTSVSTRILENDWFCDIEKSNVSISIESQPEFGHAIIDSESIVYTPAVEYKDRDELIYKVTESTGEIVSYGLLSFHDYGEVTIQKIPSRMVTSLFFVDENTGFLGTNAGLFKTTDGGTNWNVMVEGFFNDIFFLDAQRGFASYAWGGYVTTNDGGATWKWHNVKAEVGPVVFISETTGFIGVYDGSDFGPEPAGVLKTEDGGVTWRKVLSGWEVSDIQFANSTTGYARMTEGTFQTKDAGETWDILLDVSVGNFQVTCANKLFGNANAIILTSQNASTWRPVAHFLSTVYSIGFSPSCEVGFALVVPQNTYSDPNLRPISIFKTVDKGETWVEEVIDEPLEGYPLAMSIPSNDVAYFLCYDRIIKYSR